MRIWQIEKKTKTQMYDSTNERRIEEELRPNDGLPFPGTKLTKQDPKTANRKDKSSFAPPTRRIYSRNVAFHFGFIWCSALFIQPIARFRSPIIAPLFRSTHDYLLGAWFASDSNCGACYSTSILLIQKPH